MFVELRLWIERKIDSLAVARVCRRGYALSKLSDYFWVVMVKQQSTLANEQPNSFKLTAIQLSHDDIINVWDFTMMDGDSVKDFVNKLRDTQGVNNVCFLNNTVDFGVIRGAIDKLMPL